LTDNK